MTGRTSQRLLLLCWEGYHTGELLEPFNRRHGVQVDAETLLSDAGTAAAPAHGDYRHWDVLNINNAYVCDYLSPLGLTNPLDEACLSGFAASPLAGFERQKGWIQSPDGTLIGVCQRFGPFNLVVNNRRIDTGSAEDQGFALAADPVHRHRFGILEYDRF